MCPEVTCARLTACGHSVVQPLPSFLFLGKKEKTDPSGRKFLIQTSRFPSPSVSHSLSFRSFIPADHTPPHDSRVHLSHYFRTRRVLFGLSFSSVPRSTSETAADVWHSYSYVFLSFTLSLFSRFFCVSSSHSYVNSFRWKHIDWPFLIVTNAICDTLTVPPAKIEILSPGGKRLEGVIGPLLEGESLRVTCRSSGADPPANVTWWRKGQLFDDTFEMDSNGIVINDLEIKKLTADDLMSVLTCQASNTESVPPLEASILVDITSKSCICFQNITSCSPLGPAN